MDMYREPQAIHLGENGLEPATVPARRDALTASTINEFLDQAMRLPRFKLPFTPPSLGKCRVFLLINQRPRAATSCIKAASALVLRESYQQIHRASDVKLFCSDALKDVKKSHRKEMVGPNGLEPSTSSVSRKRSNQLSYGPIKLSTYRLEPATFPASRDALTN
jgi:hypothetical protein